MRWPWFKPRLSRAEKAAQASALAVSTRDVKRVRDAKFAANIAGLRAYVDAEARAKFDTAMSAIEGLGSSQSQPVPGRHRAARNLKLSTHGGAR